MSLSMNFSIFSLKSIITDIIVKMSTVKKKVLKNFLIRYRSILFSIVLAGYWTGQQRKALLSRIPTAFAALLIGNA
jgi:hypothetical protein